MVVIGLTGFAREMIFAENENFYFELRRMEGGEKYCSCY